MSVSRLLCGQMVIETETSSGTALIVVLIIYIYRLYTRMNCQLQSSGGDQNLLTMKTHTEILLLLHIIRKDDHHPTNAIWTGKTHLHVQHSSPIRQLHVAVLNANSSINRDASSHCCSSTMTNLRAQSCQAARNPYPRARVMVAKLRS